MKVGEFVFYPGHGVAEVVGIEDRDIGDHNQSFYVLKLLSGGRSLVPTQNADHARLRALISQNKAKTLLKKMKAKPAIDNTKNWKERAADYTDSLKTGSPEGYTDVLLELMLRAKEDKLSTTEQRHLEMARTYFLTEVGTVLKLSPEKVEQNITASVALS